MMEDNFNFNAVAVQEFRFLLDNGFSLSKADAKLIEFASEFYSIELYWDRDGVDLGIKSIQFPKLGSFGFSTLVRVFDKQAAEHLPVFISWATRDAVENRLRFLAQNFRQYVKLEDLKSPALLNNLRTQAEEQLIGRYPTITWEELQSRFHKLWEDKRYKELVNTFSPFRERLTKDERAIYEKAQRALAADAKSPDWFECGLPHIWLPYTQMKTTPAPLAAARTLGSRITLANGRELVDGIASWWTAVHGYNHPHIVEAIERQARLMPHVMLGGLLHEQAATLAARLADITPGDLTRVFFSDSGSVAVEVAMKMAMQYWLNKNIRGRSKFLAFKGGYHGDTIATMAVCDPEEGMHALFTGLLPEHHVIDLPRDEQSIAAFDAFLERHAGELAGILVEPMVQGAGGMIFHEEKVLQRLRKAADKYDLLLIFDEIFTGFGRTGAMFACEAAGVAPDIMTLGKGLTGGTLPLAATIASQKVFDAFWSDDPAHALMHGPTYMGNALACAAANASLDLFERENRLLQANEIAKLMGPALGQCLGLPGVVDVRVRGAIGVVELDNIADLAALKRRFVEEGVWVRPFRNIVYLTPALTIEAEDLKKLTDSIAKVLAG